jgi:hypothetical protein
MHKSQLTILIFATVFSTFSVAGMYKWTDESGNVHYSQGKPLNYEYTKVGAPPPPPSDSRNVNEDFIRQIEEKAAERKGGGAPDLQTAEQKEAASANCVTARKNLETFNNNARIRYMNDQGRSVLMTDEERAERLEQTQKSIDFYCK